MAGSIVGAPQVQQDPQGGIALSWTADIPAGETVLSYTVNIYNAATNTLVNTVTLLPPPIFMGGSAIWDLSNWDQGTWGLQLRNFGSGSYGSGLYGG